MKSLYRIRQMAGGAKHISKHSKWVKPSQKKAVWKIKCKISVTFLKYQRHTTDKLLKIEWIQIKHVYTSSGDGSNWLNMISEWKNFQLD